MPDRRATVSGIPVLYREERPPARIGLLTRDDLAAMRKGFVDVMTSDDEAPVVRREWDKETKRLITWLRKVDLPRELRLNAWTVCMDTDRLRSALLARVEGGRCGWASESAADQIRELNAAATAMDERVAA